MKIMAIDVGGTAIKYGLVSENGEILQADECASEAKQGADHLVGIIKNIIRRHSDYNMIGISTAGQVNPVKGYIAYASDNIPGYTGCHLKAILTSEFGVPVTVENDVNCAALGEAFVGAGNNSRDFLCLTYGTGVGGAIIQDRAIFTGTNYSAGEFGHMITHGGGLPCACGQNGCYEQYASTTALVRMVFEKTGENLNGKEIFARLNNGDKIVKGAVKEWLNEIIYGLVTLIHIYNPACIITGGGIMNENYINDYLNLMIKDRVMPPYRNLVIKKAALGNKAGLLGAAYNAMSRINGFHFQ